MSAASTVRDTAPTRASRLIGSQTGRLSARAIVATATDLAVAALAMARASSNIRCAWMRRASPYCAANSG